MDPGHFLTNSGSKIPMPKSRKDGAVVQPPTKPKLAFSKMDLTNLNPENDGDVSAAAGQQKSRVVTNCKYHYLYLHSNYYCPGFKSCLVALTQVTLVFS